MVHLKTIDSFFQSIKNDNVSEVRLLLKEYPEVLKSSVGFKNKTPVHMCKSCEMLRLILENGGDPNGVDDQWDTPLGNLSTGNISNVDMMNVLVEFGADVNKKDILGRNPFFYCSVDMINVLKVLGGNINDTDVDGNTPLHYICETLVSTLEIDVLLSAGADPRIVSKGETPSQVLSRTSFYFNMSSMFEKLCDVLEVRSEELDRYESWARKRDLALVMFSYGERTNREDTHQVYDGSYSLGDMGALRLMIEDGVSGSGYTLVSHGKEWGRMVLEYL